MSINQRVRELRESKNLGRGAFADICKINKRTIENIERELQKINGDHIEAITKEYPDYAYWMVTGLTLPESGQISPELEDQRQKLDKVG